jgi:hypothetical protein
LQPVVGEPSAIAKGPREDLLDEVGDLFSRHAPPPTLWKARCTTRSTRST